MAGVGVLLFDEANGRGLLPHQPVVNALGIHPDQVQHRPGSAYPKVSLEYLIRISVVSFTLKA